MGDDINVVKKVPSPTGETSREPLCLELGKVADW